VSPSSGGTFFMGKEVENVVLSKGVMKIQDRQFWNK
jgi:hypothetical protein